MKKTGFVGLGNMGLPMAGNLLKAGYEVRGFDLVPEAMRKFADAGGGIAASQAEAAADAELFISMLPASRHVRGLYLDDGLLDALAPGTLIIDCSTIAPDVSRLVSDEAKKRGLEMLDAPVSGGTAGAEAGTLTFIVGGEKEAFAKAEPVLAAMGGNLFHAGAAGAGQTAKICNNLLLAIHMTGTAEALQLGVSAGLDPAVLSEIMRKSSGGNWSLEVYNPWPGVMENAPATRDYQGGFLVDLMVKDLGLALDAALQEGVSTPMGALARNLYTLLQNRGLGGRDFSSIQTLFQPENRT